MAQRPAKVWSGTEWVDIGAPVAAPATAYYQPDPPTGAQTGDIWIDENGPSAYVNPNDFVLKTELDAFAEQVAGSILNPFFKIG